MAAATAITIGNFDGVHIGHAELISRARRLAGPQGRVIVYAFFPHPLTRLTPERAPAVLTPLEEKTRLVRAHGADELRVLAPDDALLGMSPRAFLEHIAGECAPAWIVEGDDFHYGAGRAGNVGVLQADAAELGIRVEVAGNVEVELRDQSQVRASSTIARWLLSHGRAEEAARVLGRPYALSGVVDPAEQRGRGLGFRTANLAPAHHVPGEGVYACRALIPGGATKPAAVSIGTNPTFRGNHLTVEAHVLDWDGEGAPEYGYPLTLEFLAWVREQRVYTNPAALADQIARDVADIRGICAEFAEGTEQETAV